MLYAKQYKDFLRKRKILMQISFNFLIMIRQMRSRYTEPGNFFFLFFFNSVKQGFNNKCNLRTRSARIRQGLLSRMVRFYISPIIKNGFPLQIDTWFVYFYKTDVLTVCDFAISLRGLLLEWRSKGKHRVKTKALRLILFSSNYPFDAHAVNGSSLRGKLKYFVCD